MNHFSLLPRKRNSDKSNFGHVLIVAGSKMMPGAAILTARAALRSGGGLVTVASTKRVTNLIARAIPEAMLLLVTETKEGSIGAAAFEKILNTVEKKRVSVLAVGPGLSQNKQTTSLVRRLVLEAPVPVVLDADGLNSFKGKADLLQKRISSLVLTPHKREFERLFGARLPEKPSARVRLAKRLSKFYDVVLVIKGHRTLVIRRDKAFVNKTGNPGMAKGGSGDVLTGILAAFIAQGLGVFEAARWAAYFHGRSADIAVRDKGELGLTASDIIDYLPKAFSSS